MVESFASYPNGLAVKVLGVSGEPAIEVARRLSLADSTDSSYGGPSSAAEFEFGGWDGGHNGYTAADHNGFNGFNGFNGYDGPGRRRLAGLAPVVVEYSILVHYDDNAAIGRYLSVGIYPLVSFRWCIYATFRWGHHPPTHPHPPSTHPSPT